MSLCSLAMMYIFRRGMIHSAVAGIYNCHWPTWVRQTDVSLQADGESDGLLNRDTVFPISFTNHFPSDGSYSQSLEPSPRCLLLPPLTHLPPPSQPATQPLFLFLSCSFSSSYLQHKDSSERGKKWHHHYEGPNNSLHCWNSCSTSWVWPHLADSQHTRESFLQFFFSPSPSPAVWRSYVQYCYHHILRLCFTTGTQAFPAPVFCFTYCKTRMFDASLKLLKIWVRHFSNQTILHYFFISHF